MSIVTGPYTLAATGPGSTVQIPQPQQAGYESSYLILDNLSTFLLQVQIGATVKWQAPLVEAAYDLSGSNTQPVLVTAFVVPGDTSTSGQVAPTWLGQTENPQGNYPIALSGPAEVAAATAAALLTSGIPNVLTETQILTNVTIPRQGAGGTQIVDVHGYASLLAILGPTGGGNVNANAFFRDPNNAVLQQIGSTMVFPIRQTSELLIPVLAPQLVITNLDSGNGVTCNLYGFNRNLADHVPLPGASGAGFNSPDGFTASTGSVAMTSGNTYPLTPAVPSFFGPAFAEFIILGSTVKGAFQFTAPLPNGAGTYTFHICDSTEMHADSASPANTILTKLCALPANIGSLSFLCHVAGTTTCIMQAVPDYV